MHPFLPTCCTLLNMSSKQIFKVLLQSTFVIYLFSCHFSASLSCIFSCIPIIVMPCLCLCLIFDCFLHLSVYLHWTFPSVTTSFARILARGIVEFISEQFQFPFCSFCSIALSLCVSFSFLLFVHSVLCWNSASLFIPVWASVCLWLQTQLYYRYSLKVTSSVHNSSGIFRILNQFTFKGSALQYIQKCRSSSCSM